MEPPGTTEGTPVSHLMQMVRQQVREQLRQKDLRHQKDELRQLQLLQEERQRQQIEKEQEAQRLQELQMAESQRQLQLLHEREDQRVRETQRQLQLDEAQRALQLLREEAERVETLRLQQQESQRQLQLLQEDSERREKEQESHRLLQLQGQGAVKVEEPEQQEQQAGSSALLGHQQQPQQITPRLQRPMPQPIHQMMQHYQPGKHRIPLLIPPFTPQDASAPVPERPIPKERLKKRRRPWWEHPILFLERPSPSCSPVLLQRHKIPAHRCVEYHTTNRRVIPPAKFPDDNHEHHLPTASSIEESEKEQPQPIPTKKIKCEPDSPEQDETITYPDHQSTSRIPESTSIKQIPDDQSMSIRHISEDYLAPRITEPHMNVLFPQIQSSSHMPALQQRIPEHQLSEMRLPPQLDRLYPELERTPLNPDQPSQLIPVDHEAHSIPLESCHSGLGEKQHPTSIPLPLNPELHHAANLFAPVFSGSAEAARSITQPSSLNDSWKVDDSWRVPTSCSASTSDATASTIFAMPMTAPYPMPPFSNIPYENWRPSSSNSSDFGSTFITRSDDQPVVASSTMTSLPTNLSAMSSGTTPSPMIDSSAASSAASSSGRDAPMDWWGPMSMLLTPSATPHSTSPSASSNVLPLPAEEKTFDNWQPLPPVSSRTKSRPNYQMTRDQSRSRSPLRSNSRRRTRSRSRSREDSIRETRRRSNSPSFQRRSISPIRRSNLNGRWGDHRSRSPRRFEQRPAQKSLQDSVDPRLDDNCAYCPSTSHTAMNCKMYPSALERGARAGNLRLCWHCLDVYNPERCNTKPHRRKCSVCDWTHFSHPSMCKNRFPT